MQKLHFPFLKQFMHCIFWKFLVVSTENKFLFEDSFNVLFVRIIFLWFSYDFYYGILVEMIFLWFLWFFTCHICGNGFCSFLFQSLMVFMVFMIFMILNFLFISHVLPALHLTVSSLLRCHCLHSTLHTSPHPEITI